MIKIVLEQADNGVIKTVEDDNINGAGEVFESKVVYNFEDDGKFQNTKKFLFDIAKDMGVETGNKYDKDNLTMVSVWGNSYDPTGKEITKKIKELQIEISFLEAKLEIEEK